MARRDRDSVLAEMLGLLEEPEMGLGPDRRRRILRETASFRRQGIPAPVRPSRIPAVAWGSALGTALLIVLVGQIWAPMNVQDSPEVSAAVQSPQLVMADYRDGQMILEWSDGGRETFTVRKDTSVQAARKAPGEQVQGHRFVDRVPSDSRVIFYVVE